jgi:hypothetical protein
MAFHEAGDFVDLAGAHIGRGPHRMQRHDATLDDVEIDSAGQSHSLFETRFRRALIGRVRGAASAGRSHPRFDDERASAARPRGSQQVRVFVAIM